MNFEYLILLFLFKINLGNSKKHVIVLVNHINTNLEEHDFDHNRNSQSLRNKCMKYRNGRCVKMLRPRIVGGHEVTEISSYPYHARYGSNCAAVILDRIWAITVAHCGVQDFIRVGSKIVDEGTVIPVAENIIHPGWQDKNKRHPFDYDYQLLKLGEEIEFSAKVKPIAIGSYADVAAENNVTVTGWGSLSVLGPRAKVLQVVSVPIVEKKDCQRVKFPLFQNMLTPRMFCAGFFEGRKDACQGDSGGAAAANGRLVGLVSFGFGCATPEAYGVYSDVVEVKPWIEMIMRPQITADLA